MDPTDLDMQDMLEGIGPRPKKVWKKLPKPDGLQKIYDYFLETDSLEEVANKFRRSKADIMQILEKGGLL